MRINSLVYLLLFLFALNLVMAADASSFASDMQDSPGTYSIAFGEGVSPQDMISINEFVGLWGINNIFRLADATVSRNLIVIYPELTDEFKASFLNGVDLSTEEDMLFVGYNLIILKKDGIDLASQLNEVSKHRKGEPLFNFNLGFFRDYLIYILAGIVLIAIIILIIILARKSKDKKRFNEFSLKNNLAAVGNKPQLSSARDRDLEYLRSYVVDNISQGFSRESIRAALLKRGWDSGMIDGAFS